MDEARQKPLEITRERGRAHLGQGAATAEQPEGLERRRFQGEADRLDAGDVLFTAGAHTHGEHIMHTWVFWAFVVGIGLGFGIYMNGYAIADVAMRFLPVRMVHTWLYRRMCFDELYFSVFVAITIGLSRFSAWFDRTIVDGIVNLAGWTVRQSATLVGLHDKYVIDGAVNGAGKLTYELGSAVRVPTSGRIRVYVTVLMVAVALGLAGAIIVALS